MTSALTDRYISATLRGVAPDSHEDVRRELQASIADAVEARIEHGEEPEPAERAALEELGDPAKLAAGLSDRPLQLIGPRYYLAWLRLLRLLLLIVPVCVAALATIEPAVNGEGGGAIIAEFLAAGVTTAMHVFFWTTLGFAVADRIAAADPSRRSAAWTVDRLSVLDAPRRNIADPIATAIALVAVSVGFWWDRFIGWVVLDGEAVSIFSPALWPWWMLALFAVFAASIAFQVVLYIRGRWTTSFAVVNTALNLIGVSWLVTLLGRGDLFNSRLIDLIVEHGGIDDEVLTILAIVIGLGGAAIAAAGTVDGWVKRARAA